MAVKSVTRFGIQRKIVANMTTESWQNIPHVSYQYEPDVTKFVEEFKKYIKELLKMAPIIKKRKTEKRERLFGKNSGHLP